MDRKSIKDHRSDQIATKGGAVPINTRPVRDFPGVSPVLLQASLTKTATPLRQKTKTAKREST